MADGDASAGTDAANAGLPVMTGTEDINLVHRFINTTRDLLVTFVSAAVTGLQESVTAIQGSVASLQGETALASFDGGNSHNRLARWSADGHLQGPAPTSGNHLTTRAYVDDTVTSHTTGLATSASVAAVSAAVGGKRDQGNCDFGGNTFSSSYIRGHTVTSSYVAVYANGDNTIGISPSAARFKQDVRPASHSLEDIAKIAIVNYRLRDAVAQDGDRAPVELGIIAEQLAEAGFHELVVYDRDGQALTIDYARLAVVAIDGIQQLAQRVTALENGTH